MILSPGFHPDIAAARYHADDLFDVPTLSSSIAKVLLRDTPRHAWTKHPRLGGNMQKLQIASDDRFDLGSVVHELILGKGAGFHVVDAPDWRKKEAQAERAAARESGAVPILAKHLATAEHVARAASGRLLDMGVDLPSLPTEAVLLWCDWREVACRAMLDAVDLPGCTLFDIKTTERGLSDDAIERTIDALGYDLSAGFYIRGLEALFPETAGRWRMVWIFLEIEPPFELRVKWATPGLLRIGGGKAAIALAVWEECLRTGVWPGYAPEMTPAGINDYAAARWEAREGEHLLANIAPFPARVLPSREHELLGAC